MLYNYAIDPSDINYNPCGDGIRGCLLCVLAGLDELESDTAYVSRNPSDKQAAEQLQDKIEQFKDVLQHAVNREFFM